MKVFHILIGLIQGFLLKIFPSWGYEGVINTQISIYNRLKKRTPWRPENDLLNHLIISRIESLPRVAPKEEEYAHYRTLLENPHKTLEDVINTIVEYEYILSREEHMINKSSRMGFTQPQILVEIDKCREEIRTSVKESIEKRTKA